MDAAGWDERYAATDLVWSAEPNRFVAEELADLPPGRALDLAAGEGRNAIWLARRGWEVTAVDFSQVALDKGRRLEEEGVTFAEVVQGVRRRTAEQYLRDSDMSLRHLASELGYLEQSTFTRACRRWFGMSPLAYRRALRTPAGVN